MVLNGIDCIDGYAELLKGQKLGLITSISAIDTKLNSTIDVLHSKFKLTALFAPEHGVRGDMAAGASVSTYIDKETNLPVHSLYTKDRKRFTKEMLSEIDTVVYDIQDLGTRYYTFISTLINSVEDCAEHGKKLVVLDRFNPLGGTVCEGNLLKEQFKSFVGVYPLTMRYALTAGELATMVNAQKQLNCELNVVKCENWQRDMMFNSANNIWVAPSLGIPRFDTALMYPGTCLFEGTNMSEGRGTAAPFEIIGAPYINARQYAQKLNALCLDGVAFTPVYFTPTTSKHCGEKCEGVHLHIKDYEAFRPVKTALYMIYTAREMYGSEFAYLPPFKQGGRQFISLLCGDDILLKDDLSSIEKLVSSFESDSKEFADRKKKYHLYD